MDERNFTFMFYGFTAAWAVLVLYVLMLVSRERNLRRQLDGLKSLLEHKEKR
ncbi:MAG TPA: CcmD family protein [Bryobacteraceae bacterium]|nr:CcmD family protein [Bryobacteraceae bacterium]